MHPQIEYERSGECPICDMDMEPKSLQPDVEEDDTELHSLIVQLGDALCIRKVRQLPASPIRQLDGHNRTRSVFFDFRSDTPHK